MSWVDKVLSLVGGADVWKAHAGLGAAPLALEGPSEELAAMLDALAEDLHNLADACTGLAGEVRQALGKETVQ
jgi:hypothetical protein